MPHRRNGAVPARPPFGQLSYNLETCVEEKPDTPPAINGKEDIKSSKTVLLLFIVFP
jgi:hypothetical protein